MHNMIAGACRALGLVNSGSILVFGGQGQVGREILAELDCREGFSVVAPKRSDLDLTDARHVREVIGSRPWSAVINAAAFTAVDAAEADIVSSWFVNALAPAILAEATRGAGLALIHLSTDYVFDGTKSGAYSENDPTRPLGVYGASKLAGEDAIRTGNPEHLIVRTAWVVSRHRQNFVKTILARASEGKPLRVINDQRGSPTAASDLAKAIAVAAKRFIADRAVAGTYHFVNSGETTWFGLAEAVLEASRRRGGPVTEVVPITTADYPTAARRPANSRLATDKFQRTFAVTPRPWQDAVTEVVDQLIPESANIA